MADGYFLLVATQVPAVVLDGVPQQDAEEAVAELRDVGAEAEVREQPPPDFLRP